MSLSVALCTYNGEKYLAAQLDSIAAQSRLPDELVVCDDGSTDATVDILQAFADAAPFPVRIRRNPVNLRSTANFAQAIELCTGDIITLADQDDVWHAGKLAALADELEAQPAAALAFSDADLVDETLRPMGCRAWQAIGLSRRKQQLLAQGDAHRVFLSQYVVTGATMAFRRQYLGLLLPIPTDWVHDAWIAMLLAAVAPMRLIARPLIDYRQHAAQQIGLRWRGPVGLFRLALSLRNFDFQRLHDQYRQAYERLRGESRADPRFVAGLEDKLAHLERRIRVRRARWTGLPALASEVARGNYGRYSYGWKSVIQDLFF